VIDSHSVKNENVGPKETPNFAPSGALYKEQRVTRCGKELKFVEPLDAKRPDKRWRLYVFKNGKLLQGEDGVFYVDQKVRNELLSGCVQAY